MSGRPRIESQLKALRTLDHAALANLYQQFYGGTISGSVSRDLLEAAIGYWLQKQLIARLRHRLTQTLIAGEAIVAAVAADHEQTVLVCSWKGQCHVVMVLDDGSVDYSGKIYTSLELVAGIITGGKRSADQLFGHLSSDRPSAMREASHGRR